jgi:hypothetical protein
LTASSVLDEKVAAERLGVSVHTLRKWRHARRGPRFVKLPGAERSGRGREGAVRYRTADLEAFLEGASFHAPDPHREGTMIEAARPCFDLTTTVSISVPVPSTERRLLIRDLDWRRIRRSLNECRTPPAGRQVAYSTLFSIGGTALLSVPSLAKANSDLWLFSLYWLVAGVCIVVGIAFVVLDRSRQQQYREIVGKALEQMDEVERGL